MTEQVHPRSSSRTSAKSSRFSQINLGIVCPMANEEVRAAQFVNELLDLCQTAGFASVRMFAVLDNASKDNTLRILRELEKQRPELRVVWAPENRSVVD